jgi:hypothetical protein
MTKHSIAASCALALAALGFASTGIAGDGKDMKATKELKEVVKESCITGDIGVQVVSSYVSRGSFLEDQGFIAQPYLDLYFKLYSGDGFINNVSLALGLWSSLHSEKTQAGFATGNPGHSTTPAWYEFDYTAGINTTFAKNFTLGLTWLEFNYPNDNFGVQRLGQVKLSYNDADLLGKFALNPYVKYEYYFQNPNGGEYFEAGITPGVDVGPVRVNFPIIAGFGAGHFYGHEGFAYVSGGVTLTYNLAFIPECYGKWAINAGYTFYYLDKGNSLDTFNTGPGGVRNPDTTENVFSGGIGLTF